MTMIVEDGSGVASANAYTTEAFVLAYLTDRNRQTENSWDSATSAVKQAAIIAATDYIENTFGLRFKGSKEFQAIKLAKGLLTFVDNPSDTEVVVIGSRTYTFNTALGGADSILIGADAETSLNNLLAAINGDTGEGTLYGTGTVVHPDVTGNTFEGTSVVIEAKVVGLAGNAIVTTTTVTNAIWTGPTLSGGSDVGKPQPLSFPRLNLLDSDSITVRGMPDKLKFATAEYAVRAAAATLQPDPTDSELSGQIIEKKEKVGPIEEVTKFSEGAPLQDTIRPYPAADKLLKPFLKSSGGVIRA